MSCPVSEESSSVLLALPSLHFLFSCSFVDSPLSPWPAVAGVCYSKAGASIIKMQFNFSCALILPLSLSLSVLFSVVLIKLLTSAYPLDEIDTCLFTVIITLLAPTHNDCLSQGFFVRYILVPRVF